MFSLVEQLKNHFLSLALFMATAAAQVPTVACVQSRGVFCGGVNSGQPHVPCSQTVLFESLTASMKFTCRFKGSQCKLLSVLLVYFVIF